jgi:hypothetical protein
MEEEPHFVALLTTARRRQWMMMTESRLSINAAARQVAAAWGLKVRYRETFEAQSGRLVVRWMLESTLTVPGTGAASYEMYLTCTPPLWGGLNGVDGWEGQITLRGPDDEWVMGRVFVGVGEQLAGRAACPLTRQRFRTWAATLEPDSFTARRQRPASRRVSTAAARA